MNTPHSESRPSTPLGSLSQSNGIPQSPEPPSGVRATAEAFGFEWTTHADLRHLYPSPGRLRDEFATFMIPPDFFTGKRVLDAGCGMGRFSLMAAEQGARDVVGMDLHDGVYAARQLTASTGSVRLVKGSIFDPPFPLESFDSVMSIGVIHHTGDTRRAFDRLAALVRPGGRLFIQVYATRGPVKDRRMNTLLQWTTRMPRRLLYGCCILVVALRATPLLKYLVQAVNHFVMVVSWNRRRSFWRNVADTFDWHCCPYRTYHTQAEVVEWFRQEGFTDVRVTNPDYGGGVNVLGTRP